MTIRHLRIFVTVCEEGGVSPAAKALHLAQPSVSLALSEIEKYYRVTLFDRIRQRLVITDSGRELLFKAKEVLDAFDGFEKTASRADEHPTVRIGSSLTLGKTHLPFLLSHLQKTFPEVKFQTKIDKTTSIEAALIDGKLDFAFVEGKITSPNLVALPFAEDSLVAVASPDYPIEKELSLASLCKHPLLLREKGSASRDLFDSAVNSASLFVQPIAESASNEALISFCEHGLGVAVLPEGLLLARLDEGKLKALTVSDNQFKRHTFFLTHKQRKYSTLQKKICDFVKELVFPLEKNE